MTEFCNTQASEERKIKTASLKKRKAVIIKNAFKTFEKTLHVSVLSCKRLDGTRRSAVGGGFKSVSAAV